MTYSLEINVNDRKNQSKSFVLTNPTSVSRNILYREGFKSSEAFYLPIVQSTPLKTNSGFIGDINKGGPCNVNVLSFCPHSLTHIETSSHITNDQKIKITVKDLEPKLINGLVFLLDCISESAVNNKVLNWEFIRKKLDNLEIIPDILALKTKSSQLPEHYNFSGKNFISLGQKVSKSLTEKYPDIKVLILDLPSADAESDTKLMSHKDFFLFKENQEKENFSKQKAIIELAHFGSLNQDYYFCMMTPTKIETDAMITDILFWNLKAKN
ncbi:MAG: Kynurenine formamidase [Candidatus Heimdallarchaeota archaeon LC_3]|nr:MAG: Kynurenine formamidase [Candidatus Heimdallarchaeota archaeon LC_3]